MRHHKLLFGPLLFVAVVVALGGCATLVDSAPPLTIDALVERSQQGESTQSLLASLRASRERFTLSGSDYALLKERGLPEPVLDELQIRALHAARDDQWQGSRFYSGPWFPFGNFSRYVYVPFPSPPHPKPK